MTNNHDEWLKLTTEQPIEPDLPICDAHHHLWHRPSTQDRPGSRYLFEELLDDVGSGHNIVKTVFVQCGSMYRKDGPEEMKPVGETEFVQGVAAMSASGQYGPTEVAAGIVGYADLTIGDAIAPMLEAHIRAGRNFRGIRYMTSWEDNPEFPIYAKAPHMLMDPGLRRGFACLERYGLSFDAWLHHTQLMELVDLARVFPDTPIILDHIGGPILIGSYAGKREEVFEEWKRGIAELATCPNVVVKLGGIGLPLLGFGWHERSAPPGSAEMAEATAPYYLWCIERFGVDRCMFESNFPVDKRTCSYTVLWNAFKIMTKDFSAQERAALFHDTAAKVYRLGTDR
jgi:predicted TIM-barrel fold metal-dependent hydrolase